MFITSLQLQYLYNQNINEFITKTNTNITLIEIIEDYKQGIQELSLKGIKVDNI